jgi:hypothetical protein
MPTSTHTLTRRVYTIAALTQTVEAFADICNASLTESEDAFILQITCTGDQGTDEFLNYALGLSAQELLR